MRWATLTLSPSLWSPQWWTAHGETRSASRITFHIGFRLINGHYWSCILVGQIGQMPIQDTEVDWGTTAPRPSAILEHYRAMFGYEPASDKLRFQALQDDDDNDNSGAGKQSGKNVKRVFNDKYGGFTTLTRTVVAMLGTQVAEIWDFTRAYETGDSESLAEHRRDMWWWYSV